MANIRREFLRAIAAGGAALGAGWTSGSPIEAVERAALDAARKQAAHRRRRIIYNNDGDDIWAKGADTLENFLAVRHEPLLGTQVDSIYYCTTQSFNLFTHSSRVAEVFLSREGTFANNNLKSFIEQGTDGLRMSCNFARKHGLESIWTLRMNDIHDCFTPQYVSQWKKDDPRRVMAKLADVSELKDRRRLWSLVDFEHADVEPRVVAIIEDVLRNYPVDGIELDFLRAPFYFRTTYEGKPATDKQVGVLTRLVESIRKSVLAESERQGKPLLLAARVPVTKQLCNYIGIDVAGWLSASMIDVLSISGGYVAFDQPVTELIELGHQNQVPVYPCLSQSGLNYRPPRGKEEPQPPAAWNGAAARLWDAGADGIYSFNLFPGPGTTEQRDYAVTVLKNIGSKESLMHVDRMFAVCDAGWGLPGAFWAKDVEEFSNSLPLSLDGKPAITVQLIVPGPIPDSPTSSKQELRLDFAGLAETEVPAVTINSHRLDQANFENIHDVRRYRFPIPLSNSKMGANEIRVEGISEKVKLAGVELWITRTES